MSTRALGTIQTLSDMILGCIGAKRHRIQGKYTHLKYNTQCTATPPLRVFLCSFWKSWDLSYRHGLFWYLKSGRRDLRIRIPTQIQNIIRACGKAGFSTLKSLVNSENTQITNTVRLQAFTIVYNGKYTENLPRKCDI